MQENAAYYRAGEHFITQSGVAEWFVTWILECLGSCMSVQCCALSRKVHFWWSVQLSCQCILHLVHLVLALLVSSNLEVLAPLHTKRVGQ